MDQQYCVMPEVARDEVLKTQTVHSLPQNFMCKSQVSDAYLMLMLSVGMWL